MSLSSSEIKMIWSDHSSFSNEQSSDESNLRGKTYVKAN